MESPRQAALLQALTISCLVPLTLLALGASEAGNRAAQAAPTGTLEGHVAFAGDASSGPTRVRNSTDPDVCGLEHSLEDLVWSPENRGVRHVIATLIDVPEDRARATRPRRLLLDNRNCRFVPHVLTARVGDTLVAVNSDPVLHTTHYYGPLTSNVALPAQGMRVARVIRRPGMITVLCDVHGWMRAVVRAHDHPYHSVSTRGGAFRIGEIPPGRYTLELWHERLGTRRVDVQIRAGETTRIRIEYEAPGASGASGRVNGGTP